MCANSNTRIDRGKKPATSNRIATTKQIIVLAISKTWQTFHWSGEQRDWDAYRPAILTQARATAKAQRLLGSPTIGACGCGVSSVIIGEIGSISGSTYVPWLVVVTSTVVVRGETRIFRRITLGSDMSRQLLVRVGPRVICVLSTGWYELSDQRFHLSNLALAKAMDPERAMDTGTLNQVTWYWPDALGYLTLKLWDTDGALGSGRRLGDDVKLQLTHPVAKIRIHAFPQ